MLDQTRKFYFSPIDKNLQQILLDLVNSAQKSIYICDYSFNFEPLVEILINKFKSGVTVNLVLDKSQSAGKSEVPIIQQIKDAGIPIMIGESSAHKIMHNKFMVIDSQWVEAGSLNYTGTAFLEDNFFFIESNPDLASQFLMIFNDIWLWIKTNEPQS